MNPLDKPATELTNLEAMKIIAKGIGGMPENAGWIEQGDTLDIDEKPTGDDK